MDPIQHDFVNRRRPLRRRSRILISVGLVLTFVVLGAVGYGLYLYRRLDQGLRRSTALHVSSQARPRPPGQDVNLLLMGLDSRLDVNGHPLPAAIYRAIHTGNASIGGLNSNVLMYVHVPADGTAATAFSIPRDDYVAIPGCPDGECHAKIKEAYGLAFDQAHRELARQGKTGDAAYQKARDAGRAAEVATVEQFLGVPVNHFVEVTMVAFYQIAQVVQPITVCVKENTQDRFSGANFHAGVQQIDAREAVAFVRQRRDTIHPGLNFTDLDRERRQQAFIVSLLLQLKQAGTLLNPAKLTGLIDVAKQNTVVDDGLSPLRLATLAATISGGHLHFYTLPIKAFGFDSRGQSINEVDLSAIRETVHRILHPAPPTHPTSTSKPARPAPSTATPVSPAVPSAVPATGGGRSGPAPTVLTDLSGGGVPCVK